MCESRALVLLLRVHWHMQTYYTSYLLHIVKGVPTHKPPHMPFLVLL